MQSSEKLCLKWNDFQENLNSAFGVLRNDEDFADVTLVSEDGTQIETHKVILVSSSPFFMEILKKNKHPHPLIYMRGMKAEDLVAMVDFLYFGEANVKQENLDAFLGLAEELKLKGLTNSSGTDNLDQETELPPTKNKERWYPDESNSNMPQALDKHKQNARMGSTSNAVVSVEAEQLDEQINSMMALTQNKMTVGKNTTTSWACKVCGKEDQKPNIKSHIEANHITSNVSYSCDICGKVSRSRNGLRFHKAKHH